MMTEIADEKSTDIDSAIKNITIFDSMSAAIEVIPQLHGNENRINVSGGWMAFRNVLENINRSPTYTNLKRFRTVREKAHLTLRSAQHNSWKGYHLDNSDIFGVEEAKGSLWETTPPPILDLRVNSITITES